MEQRKLFNKTDSITEKETDDVKVSLDPKDELSNLYYKKIKGILSPEETIRFLELQSLSSKKQKLRALEKVKATPKIIEEFLDDF